MKRIVASLVVAVCLWGLIAVPAFAKSATVVGTFAVADHGQGGWFGGPLRADGTIGGGGAFSISTPEGQFVARVTGGTWTGTLATGQTVEICINLQQLHGPPGFLPPTLCAQIPVNAGPVNLFEDVFGRVTTTG